MSFLNGRNGSGPGPGHYALPLTIAFISHDFTKPTSPAYSFHGRISNNCPHQASQGSSEDMSKTTGPGRYNSTDPSVYLPKQQAFSMLGRHGFPNNATLKPGPGTRNPEKVIVHKPRDPAFSLGIRQFVTPLVVNVADYTTMFLRHMGLGLTKVGFICKTNNSMR
ncbi:ciliary microtubule associated protein 1A-like [Salvelinus alpinus]|uniref:ciliary microtubule associated protein 1A-like n=1 Tax=Salvelinus alpinus TaxID=8036 RepID=UPI0039FC510A